MKKKKILLLCALTCSIYLVLFTAYQQFDHSIFSRSKNRDDSSVSESDTSHPYSVEKYGGDITHLFQFGKNKAFISFSMENPNPYLNSTVAVGQHFLWTNEEYKDIHVPGSILKESKWKFHVYSLDESGSKKDIDLFQLVDKWDSDYFPYVYSGGFESDKNEDYVYIRVKKKSQADKEDFELGRENYKDLRINVRSEEVNEITPDKELEQRQVIELNLFYFTNIPKLASDKGVTFKDSSVFTIDFKKFPLKDERINFSKEIENLNYNKDLDSLQVTIKESRISDEELFQEMRRLLAPEGQEGVEVIATDPTTGEQTPIYSAADYQAWKEAHLHLFKGKIYFINDIKGRTKEDPGLGMYNPNAGN